MFIYQHDKYDNDNVFTASVAGIISKILSPWQQRQVVATVVASAQLKPPLVSYAVYSRSVLICIDRMDSWMVTWRGEVSQGMDRIHQQVRVDM